MARRGIMSKTRSLPLDLSITISSLHPTAQKILEAGYAITEERGLSALTFDAIAERAGVYKGSITYFFGDKANLLVHLAELAIHDLVASSLQELNTMSDASGRLHEVIAANTELSLNATGSRVFLEIVVEALRGGELGERTMLRYRDWRDATRRSLESQATRDVPQEVERVATLTTAISDGLSLQHALDSRRLDPTPYWAAWEEMVRLYLTDAARRH